MGNLLSSGVDESHLIEDGSNLNEDGSNLNEDKEYSYSTSDCNHDYDYTSHNHADYEKYGSLI